MSDIAAAAAAMNIPEELVERSAAARAAAAGSSTDDVLAAWAGGAPVPATATPPPAEPEAAPEPAPEPAAPEAPSQPAATTEAAPIPEPAAAGAPGASVPLPPSEPPVLEGRTEHPFLITAGAAALLAVALFVAFLAPALPQEGNGVYTSAVPLSQAGIDGRDIYRSEGCSSCHTQAVRPIVADVGLGPVTISDSNQVLGVRRYGPDLAHIGSRVESRSTLLTVLTNGGDHPSYAGLSDQDLENLTAYLFQSK